MINISHKIEQLSGYDKAILLEQGGVAMVGKVQQVIERYKKKPQQWSFVIFTQPLFFFWFTNLLNIFHPRLIIYFISYVLNLKAAGPSLMILLAVLPPLLLRLLLLLLVFLAALSSHRSILALLAFSPTPQKWIILARNFQTLPEIHLIQNSQFQSECLEFWKQLRLQPNGRHKFVFD